MSSISPDVINRIGSLQNQIWQTITQSVTEAAASPVTFANPLTVATRTADLYAEMGTPMMVIQFCFSGLPENPQVILLPQDTVAGLAELLLGQPVTEIDDNVVTDLRTMMEAVVQGICLAAGQVKSDTVVASGLSIRYQIFSFPMNLQRADEVVRTQVAISATGVNGSAIWLMDPETTGFLLGIAVEEDEEEAESPFPQAEQATGTAAPRPAFDEVHGLDRLLDIPLEISVELGRVKMLVKEVVELGTGSIVEIEKAAGEPVDVMVNGRLVARGEVVVIEDNFGVRITEILNPTDRLNRLNEAA